MKTLSILTIALLLTIGVKAQISDSTLYKSGKESRAYWNGFVDFLQTKNLKGSKELDKRSTLLSESLFNEYNTLNNKKVDYTKFIILVQTCIKKYREDALIEIHAGRTFCDIKSDDEFMVGLSKIDGFAGSKTTSWKFPVEIIINTKLKNNLYINN